MKSPFLHNSSKTVSRSFVWTAVSLVVFALVSWLAVELWLDTDEMIHNDDVHPPGRWNYEPSLGLEDRSPEELARLLSLPYLDATVEAPARSGVTIHDAERTAPGLNLYVSAHDPEVALMDIEGNVLHRWGMTFEEAFAKKSAVPGTEYIRRAQVLPNGDLVAIYQGGGMIKLDLRSRLLWATELSFYNDFFVAPDGRIWGIAKEAVDRPGVRADAVVLEDSLVVLSESGEILDRFSLLDAFLQSSYADLIHPQPKIKVIFHANTVEVMDGSMSGASTLYNAGLVLVSLREIDTVAFLNTRSRTIEQAWRGPWVMQHEPSLLPNGRLLIFDNRGAEGLARVVEFDPESHQIVWEYRGQPDLPLRSPEGGAAQRLDNGNTLITESERGRAIEITPDADMVWEFVSPYRGGRNGELVATLFEVVRIDTHALPFAAPLLRDRAVGTNQP